MTQPTLPEKAKQTTVVVNLLHNLALVAGVFAAIICVLLLVNFIQLRRTDPLNTKVMKTMVDRMHSNPEDQQLVQEIRELDLLSRKAYFTNQWQVKMGGYLLFLSLLVIIICVKTAELLQKKLPDMPGIKNRDFWQMQKTNRRWIVYTGLAIVFLSLVTVFVTSFEPGIGPEGALEVKNIETGQTEVTNPGQPTITESATTDSSAKTDTATMDAPVVADGFPGMQEIMENFPTFRGTGGNGIVFQKNLPTSWDGKSGKNIKWKTEIPLPGYNSPILWKNRIFLTGANATKRVVYCLDLESGSILWQKSPEKVPGSVAQEPKVIRETGYSAPTMTTDGRRVYAIFANGDLVSYDFEGNQIWAKNLGVPQNHYGHSSSLIMYQDMLIVQYDHRNSAMVTALAGKTGKTVWQTTRNVKISWASPVIVNTGQRTELILAADPIVASYNPANGKEYWRMECISGEVGPSVAYADGVVYSVNDYAKLAAVQIGEQPKMLWEDSEYLSDIPSPVATSKFLFMVTSYGTMVCYDAKNGTKYWEHEFGTPVFASPLVAGEKVFMLDKKGIMHIFKADKEYTSISEPALGEGSSCTPAFANGRIIIRGDKHLYCIGQ